ncbi:MAG: relaxase/mobilization nuclease domain-containing protein [Methanothrix soehngenii]|nr:relaxase/mobilization nuclease domain-containing protein [Methanothrix soehngenii]MDD3974468.1 relaxase/mobilization nuclease domain-containing protein [Methanothrix soehngenii]MDD4487041.1 relaxase/mobilization nuclease domain-containing protein [Methanothrix soehngenii]
MIAKRVPRRAGTSSPARLVRYMVAAQGGIEPESWKRTADYILDSKGTTTQGEKVASYRVTNCGTDDPAQATTIIEATQAANTRSKADKTYHLVYSFPPGERPPLDVLHAIEDELCAVIGYADHQRISAVHIDTDHLHVHVAINKVHPTGLQNVEPFFDKQRLMEACERLEIKHGLQRTNHGLTEGKAYDRPDRIQLGPERQHDSRFREFLRQSYHLALAERPEAETYNGLRNLSGSGVAHGPGRYSELLPRHARDRMEQGRTQQPDSVRRARNGAGRDGAGIDGKAADMEAHAGVDSLIGYAAREVAPAMRRATSWQELHAALAEHGLQIKPRGAGLVIGDAGLGLWCKASEAGRDLSMKALTDRLGPFERDKSRAAKEARRRYEPRPRQPHPSSAALFAEYQRQRQAAIAGRKQGFASLKTERAREAERIRQWAATQRLIIKAGPRGPVRKALYANVQAQADAARRELAANMDAKRKALIGGAGLPNWNEWLMQRAEAGDVDALAVLRSRAEREERMRGDLLTAERAERAKAAIMESLKPQARKDGTMAYRTADGGLVLDRATHVQAQHATAGAALVALSLAAERFEGQALDVRGTEQFRRDVAQLAAMHKIRVTFADPAMEALRQAAMPAPAAPPAPEKPQERPQEPREGQGGAKPPAGAKPRPAAPQRPDEAVSPAILRWIDKRNSDRSKISSIDYNRLWTSADAGAATYQGRRRMEDGSEVLLLKRGNETLVKPAGPRVVAKASRWRVGQSVTVDARGRFIDNTKGIER